MGTEQSVPAVSHVWYRELLSGERKLNFSNLRTLDIGLVHWIPKSDDRTSRWYNLVWIDKAGLSLAAVVSVGFLIVWLMLILAAGPAPTARLSTLCFEWMTKVIGEGVVPVWLIARGIHAMVLKVVQVPGLHKETAPA